MALNDFDKYKKLDVVSVSGTPTISHAVPIKLMSGDDSSTGTGEIVLDWTNISSESDLAVYDENDNLLDYWIESFDATGETAVVHVYRDWVQDGSTQCKVAYGSGPSDQSVSSSTVFDKESNLEAGWALNESSGDALDLTSNNNDGTVNGATQGATGQVDGAYDFDGTDDEVNTGIDQNAQTYTITAWAYDTGLGGAIISSDDGSNGIKVRNDGSGIKGEVKGSNNGYVTSTYSVSTGWHYVTGVYDDSVGEFSLYIDGVHKETVSGSLGDASANFYIGNEPQYGLLWDDRIDDVRIYDSALSSDEVTAKYDASKSTPGFFSQQAAESPGLEVSFSDSHGITDTKAFTLSDVLSDSVSISEIKNYTLKDILSDAVGVSDTSNFSIYLGLSDVAGYSDSIGFLLVVTKEVVNVDGSSAELKGELKEMLGSSADVYFEWWEVE